jgi:hypothetical protein
MSTAIAAGGRFDSSCEINRRKKKKLGLWCRTTAYESSPLYGLNVTKQVLEKY